VARVSARAGQAEPMFMGGGGQGMMDSLPGPPGMMMGGDPMQGLSRGFPGDSSWRCGTMLDVFWCMYHFLFDLGMYYCPMQGSAVNVCMGWSSYCDSLPSVRFALSAPQQV
jgi:hypothetical protein